MSEQANESFARMAGAHVDLANSHASGQPRELAAVAILHAAARYNAFAMAAAVQSGEQLAEVREKLISAQVEQFREALEHHYTGYVAELSAKAAS